MSDRTTQPVDTAPPYLPVLLALFVGSGCAALIYEVVWFQLLQLVIGSSAISLGVLLGTFMGGMCLGSYLLPRYIQALVYRAILESNAAFFAAQMTAMDAATRNSAEMIENLTLYMNKVRQAAITREIIEVVSGAAAT